MSFNPTQFLNAKKDALTTGPQFNNGNMASRVSSSMRSFSDFQQQPEGKIFTASMNNPFQMSQNA